MYTLIFLLASLCQWSQLSLCIKSLKSFQNAGAQAHSPSPFRPTPRVWVWLLDPHIVCLFVFPPLKIIYWGEVCVTKLIILKWIIQYHVLYSQCCLAVTTLILEHFRRSRKKRCALKDSPRVLDRLLALWSLSSVQSLSRVQLRSPMDCSRPGRWRVLTKCGPLGKGVANHFSILALRTPWTVWKWSLSYSALSQAAREGGWLSICGPGEVTAQGSPTLVFLLFEFP